MSTQGPPAAATAGEAAESRGTSGAAETSKTPDGSVWLDRVGLAPAHLVQEFGWDEDCDDDLRLAVEDRTGSALEDEDSSGVVDVVLQWWRGDDGDLTDALVDGVLALDEGGFVLLLTPRSGRGVEVEEADIHEAATTAGLHPSTSVPAGADWRAVKLVTPKTARPPSRH